eukprot:scpid70444/ scgid25230/ 
MQMQQTSQTMLSPSTRTQGTATSGQELRSSRKNGDGGSDTSPQPRASPTPSSTTWRFTVSPAARPSSSTTSRTVNSYTATADLPPASATGAATKKPLLPELNATNLLLPSSMHLDSESGASSSSPVLYDQAAAPQHTSTIAPENLSLERYMDEVVSEPETLSDDSSEMSNEEDEDDEDDSGEESDVDLDAEVYVSDNDDTLGNSYARDKSYAQDRSHVQETGNPIYGHTDLFLGSKLLSSVSEPLHGEVLFSMNKTTRGDAGEIIAVNGLEAAVDALAQKSATPQPSLNPLSPGVPYSDSIWSSIGAVSGASTAMAIGSNRRPPGFSLQSSSSTSSASVVQPVHGRPASPAAQFSSSGSQHQAPPPGLMRPIASPAFQKYSPLGDDGPQRGSGDPSATSNPSAVAPGAGDHLSRPASGQEKQGGFLSRAVDEIVKPFSRLSAAESVSSLASSSSCSSTATSVAVPAPFGSATGNADSLGASRQASGMSLASSADSERAFRAGDAQHTAGTHTAVLFSGVTASGNSTWDAGGVESTGTAGNNAVPTGGFVGQQGDSGRPSDAARHGGSGGGGGGGDDGGTWRKQGGSSVWGEGVVSFWTGDVAGPKTTTTSTQHRDSGLDAAWPSSPASSASQSPVPAAASAKTKSSSRKTASRSSQNPQNETTSEASERKRKSKAVKSSQKTSESPSSTTDKNEDTVAVDDPGSPWLLVSNIPDEMDEGALRLLCQGYGTVHNFCVNRQRGAALMRYEVAAICVAAVKGLSERRITSSDAEQQLSATAADNVELGRWLQHLAKQATSSGGAPTTGAATGTALAEKNRTAGPSAAAVVPSTAPSAQGTSALSTGHVSSAPAGGPGRAAPPALLGSRPPVAPGPPTDGHVMFYPGPGPPAMGMESGPPPGYAPGGYYMQGPGPSWDAYGQPGPGVANMYSANVPPPQHMHPPSMWNARPPPPGPHGPSRGQGIPPGSAPPGMYGWAPPTGQPMGAQAPPNSGQRYPMVTGPGPSTAGLPPRFRERSADRDNTGALG